MILVKRAKYIEGHSIKTQGHRVLLPVIISKTKNCYNASSPQFYGCVATAVTVEKVLKRFVKTITFHLEEDQAAKRKASKFLIYNERDKQKMLKLFPIDKYIKEFGSDSFYTFTEINIKL